MMNFIKSMMLAAICSLMFSAAPAVGSTLDEGFVDPAPEYGPRTWWHWLNENVSKDGITKDLEAMKWMGYKGAHMVNLPSGAPGVVEGDDIVGSPIWTEKVEFATKECERLGLEFSMGSCAGWVAGGTWMTPDLSMQDIVWRHLFVEGPVKDPVKLPQPTMNLGYYRDIAVLAFPSLPGEAQALASRKPKVSSDIPNIDWSAAIDGDPDTFVQLPRWKASEKSRSVIFEFEEPVTVRSISLQLWEDSVNRVVKLSSSNDGKQWTTMGVSRQWRNHFKPCREEMVDGYHERTARFVKLTFEAPSPLVDMKLYEVNFLSARLNQLHTKAARQRTQPPVSNPSAQVVPGDQCVEMDRVLDLTEYLKPDGTLDYELPEGNWTILRFGHTSNGNEIHPASKRASGLECDKMSAEAVRHHLDHGLVKPMFDRLGPLVGKVMVEVNIDSWEAACQTWTAKFPEEFKKRRGYDISKWLIALTGRFVESVDVTERFMWDYRRTIGDLIAENFYGAFREYLNLWGVKLSAEGPGIGIPIHSDQIQVLGMLDIPQGEFWLGPSIDPRFPQWPGGQDNTKEAAAAAHVYGKKVVSCEAFTSFGHHDGFTQYPYILKPVGDRQFCKGLNEIVFHRYAHQPDDRVPGMALGQFGLNLERTTTWWDPGRAWITYIRRCQYMLRQGRFFADVCYYYGEDVPNSAWYYAPNALDPRKKMLPVLPLGYDYDVCDRTAFDTMTVEDGHVVLPSGMRYAYLVLPDHARYTPAALEKVYELVMAGASVVGPRPSRSPSMNDFPNADGKIQELAGKLWPEAAGPGERRVGKGRVITGKSFETIFAADGVKPDFKASLSADDAEVRYIHREVDSGDMYFVASQQDYPEDVVLHFRVSGKVPEIWDPVTGKRSFTPMYRDDGETTSIALRMENYDSRFVIFRKPAEKDSVVEIKKDGASVRSLAGAVKSAGAASPEISGTLGETQLTVWESGEYEAILNSGEKSEVVVSGLPAPETVPEKWTVSFQKDRGAPEGQSVFDQLESWTENSDDGIKYFSGTASYEKGINVSQARLEEGRRVYLDLGDVKHIAEVIVNDKNLGVLWKPPFRVDITDAAKPGANKVVVKVTNVWKNRLIGDWKLPEVERTSWAMYPFYKNEPDAPLMESGLLGPVRVVSSETVSLPGNVR